MSQTKLIKAGERTQPTAQQLREQYGISVVSDKLSDGSEVFAVEFANPFTVDCPSFGDAEALAFAIAVAIRNYGMV